MDWDSYRKSLDALPCNPDFAAQTLAKLPNRPRRRPALFASGLCAAAACLAAALLWLYSEGSPIPEGALSLEGAPAGGQADSTDLPGASPSAAPARPSSPEQAEADALTVNTIADMAGPVDLLSLIGVSEAVVRGRIADISYETIDGHAWSRLTVKVEYAYKSAGSLPDTLCVYHMGGYLTAEEYLSLLGYEDRLAGMTEAMRSRLVRETVNGEPLPEIGDVKVYCLVQTPAASPLPEEGYEVLAFPYGQLSAVGDGTEFERRVSGEKPEQYTHGDLVSLAG
ncbi:MAG TPA: hypothetical protein H9674_01140 [Firmicutes bacterium]|nr:hypothetical protein [Bacillota bacterium]